MAIDLNEPNDLSRRRLLERFSAAAATAICAIAVLPGIGMILGPALARRRTRRAKLLLDAGLQGLGTDFVSARFDGQASVEPGVFVRRTETGEVAVFSAKCTHGGCAVSWSSPTRRFLCPCHGGLFDDEGKVLSGPPPRALDRIAARIEGDEVVIEAPQA